MTPSPLRVLLVYPPSRTQAHGTCRVGPLMLGAVLERAGHEVHVLDANAVLARRSSEQVAAVARELRPDVVGVTLLTPLVREAYRMAGLLRRDGQRLLAGGPHATLLPEEPLAHGFDAVAVGEGEPVVEAAVRAVAGRIPLGEAPGLVWREASGAVRSNPPPPPPADLDALPLPARHLAPAAHFQPLSTEAVAFTSRGCTARCAYCAGGLFGRRFRFRSAASVLGEVAHLHARYGTRHVHFSDDAMTMNRPRMKALCDGLRDLAAPVTWSMMTRIDAVDEEMLGWAAAARCVRIDYGVESGSAATLRRIHKPHTPAMARRVVPLTASLGIEPNVFFILGFPWEDVAALEETRVLMEELAPHVGAFHPAIGSILLPFPGTEIYDRHADAYGFRDWWLGGSRSYDVPQPGTHAYYERVAFRCGAILDADFFRYAPEVRRKIVDVFRFMHFRNLRARGRLSRVVRKAAFTASEALDRRWPALERALFDVLGPDGPAAPSPGVRP